MKSISQNPQVYVVKPGYAGVYIFLIPNIEVYSLEQPRRGGSNVYQQSNFKQNYSKYQIFL